MPRKSNLAQPPVSNQELLDENASLSNRLAELEDRLERERALRRNLADEVSGLQRKITEQDAIASELETKNAELEHFAYAVSHDLKTPLVTIKGFVGLLGQDIEAGDQDRIAVDFDQINTAADTMATLLNDLLELSRVGRITNQPAACNLGQVAGQAVEKVKGKIDALGIEIEIGDMPRVYVDEARLVEVYLNLVENAVKFMGEQISPRIRIGSFEKNGMVYSFVEDNGIGIDASYHDKIFNLFERLSADVKGTGVGLTLVKRIVEEHGGEIWVESEGSNRGSRITFSLPKSG